MLRVDYTLRWTKLLFKIGYNVLEVILFSNSVGIWRILPLRVRMTASAKYKPAAFYRHKEYWDKR